MERAQTTPQYDRSALHPSWLDPEPAEVIDAELARIAGDVVAPSEIVAGGDRKREEIVMAFHPPRPETLARRAREHAAERAARCANLRARLAELVERDGPESIWVEMLAEIEELATVTIATEEESK